MARSTSSAIPWAGTPNGGSEVADLLHDLAIFHVCYGPARQQLTTRLDATLISLPAPDYAAGIIAGNRSLHPLSSLIMLPKPNDGTVSIASTGLDGMADHVIVDAYHAELPRHRTAIGQTIAFLREGRFSPAS
jgi:hypothetical protein